MYTCDNCGQATPDAPTRFIRHEGACTCIRCEECKAVIGDEMESVLWNEQQKVEHLAQCSIT